MKDLTRIGPNDSAFSCGIVRFNPDLPRGNAGIKAGLMNSVVEEETRTGKGKKLLEQMRHVMRLKDRNAC